MSGASPAPASTVYVDADACPVREEIYRVAHRFSLPVVLVTNGSRPIRPTGLPFVRMVLVEDGADRADDWIAERIGPADLCVTSETFRLPRAALAQVRAPWRRTAPCGAMTISAQSSPGGQYPPICANLAWQAAGRRRSPDSIAQHFSTRSMPS